MKPLRNVLGACLSATLLTACGGGRSDLASSTPALVGPQAAGLSAERTRVRPAYGVLYSFKGGTGDGAYPAAGLATVNGTLYGTTSRAGGGSGCRPGCGTVFSITPSGAETVLHSFAGGSGDGAKPFAALLNVNDTLYGTTYVGGRGGTVFSITTSGAETVLHSFVGSGDGAYPHAGLINLKGTLYGTTVYGGATAYGSVFAITTSGSKETVLHSFGGSGDGQEPFAGLTDVKGTFYGTTAAGANGPGTVFSITTSGAETVLYSFKGGSDGAGPHAGLINVKGTLYGTTAGGGANNEGTVFSTTTSGTETVLYSFKGGSDGANPYAGLLNVNGTLYGTTEYGGSNSCSGYGCGTVFAITPSGEETVLYSFAGYPTDGANPQAALINVKGRLYGTTYYGGVRDKGTIFSLSP